MAETKGIADYYLERYRKAIRFANIALGSAVVVLLVNWLFAVEPGYQSLQQARRSYKNQLKQSHKELIENSNSYSRYYNRYVVNSEKNLLNIKLADTLRKQIDRFGKIELGDSLEAVKNEIGSYEFDSTRRSELEHIMDSIRKKIKSVKGEKAKLDSLKTASINESLKDYDWKSLIKFVFIVASNPREGNLYLMGLITSMFIFAFVIRWFSLHYLAKSIRINKFLTEGVNSFSDLSISAPFWLAPLPVSSKATTKVQPNNPNELRNKVDQNELTRLTGFLYQKYNYTVIVVLLLCLFFLLDLRLFYISLHSNPPIRFDFIFKVGIILLLIALGQICIWFVPIRIDDHLNNERPPNSISRRIFITAGFAALISITLLRNKNRIARFYNRNAKRYIRHKKLLRIRSAENMAAGLYSHSPHPNGEEQRKALYFFSSENYSIVLNDIRTHEELDRFKGKLQKVTVEEISPNSNFEFKDKGHSWHIEYFTLFLVGAGKTREAMKFIFDQLTTNRSYCLYDHRLTDLAARLFIRYETNENYLNKFIEYCDQNFIRAFGDDADSYFYHLNENIEPLKERVSNWRNPTWINKIRKTNHLHWNKIRI